MIKCLKGLDEGFVSQLENTHYFKAVQQTGRNVHLVHKNFEKGCSKKD
jgi:hypothetical protein